MDFSNIFDSSNPEFTKLSKANQALAFVIINAINNKMTEVIAAKDAEIKQLGETVSDLRTEVTALKKDLYDAVEKVHHLQQDNLKNVCVLSGDEVPQVTAEENTKEVLLCTIKEKLKLNIPPESVTEVSRLGRKDPNKPDRRSIRFRFSNRDIKNEATSVAIKQKRRLYINEYLTNHMKGLFDRIRGIKKNHPTLIGVAYVRDGVIYVKKRPGREVPRTPIVSERELDEYLSRGNSN